MFLKSCFLFN